MTSPEASGEVSAAASTTEASSAPQTQPSHAADENTDALKTPSPPAPSEPPPPPNPASDPRLSKDDEQTATPGPEDSIEWTPGSPLGGLPIDIFQIPSAAALQLLSACVEALVRMTGDIPPSPAPEKPETPHMRGMEAEKQNIVRSHSERTLARMRLEAEAAERASQQRQAGQSSMHLAAPSANSAQNDNNNDSTAPSAGEAADVDGVRLRAPTPQQNQPRPPPSSPEPYIVVGANSQPVNVQHSAITRKFYSRKPPPIGVADYLARLHRWCPASTAVYLAASLYIHRLAVDERAMVVTRRNAHRLLLAALRVAMKALEDRCFPHARVAQVGGVSVAELARLEISFCFLTGFELLVSAEDMQRHWVVMRDSPLGGVDALGNEHGGGVGLGAAGGAGDGALEMTLPRRQRKESQVSTEE